MRNTFLFLILIFSTVLVSGQVVVKDDITSNTTWTSSNEYHLDGLIFVDSLVTLTIEPGTVIKGLLQANITTGDGASALIVRRGAKIMAEGTADNPIIFTSEIDDLNLPDLTWQDRGLWGGVILLGRATTNQPTTENQIEGIPNELNARYGGNDDGDNSGVLSYISIRHGGFSISGIAGDEINGLTMGAVGSGTQIDHIEVFSNFDDGYEWFGGTVNTKYLVAAFCGDDAYDYDQGFRGKGQFWFTIQGQDEAGRGGEHDGGDDNETGTPYAMPYVSNATYIGSSPTATPAGDGNDRGIYFRDNAGGKYYNSIFTEYVGYGVAVEDIEGQDSRKQMEDGNLVLNNNFWWNFGAGNTVADIANNVDFVIDHLGENDNMVEDPQLRGLSWTTDSGLDPRPLLASPAVGGAKWLEDEFFDRTTFLGAFNPNKNLWTDGWTALYANGHTGDLDGGDASVVVVSDDISSDETWTANNTYFLNGLVFVDSLATLTIEAGTIVKGRLQSNITTGDGASALIVRRGGMIMAEGTEESPIIFTSEIDDLALPDLTWADRGLWGGLIVLGKATTNQPTTENQIEGIPNELNARYGGNDDNDNSGVLRFVSIRHGGFSISGIAGDEINGLTMGAVGDGTTIEYIEVFSNFDDGYEWFGGTVNTRYLVAAFCGDDAYDYDQGFRGKGQFWFTIQGQDEAGRGGEHDGGDDNETGMPYAIPHISNVTYIGSGHESVGVAGDGNDRGIYFRDNAGGKYFNSVFTEYVGYGVKVEDIEGQDSRQQMEDGNLVLNNNYWWNFGNGNTVSDIADGVDFVIDHLGANNNTVADPELRSISWEENQGLDPRPAAGSPIISGAVDMEDSWFKAVDYLGAFDPDNGIWTEGWTALSAYGFTPSTVVGIGEENFITALPTEYTLSQNYPNPFNPSTNIQFAIPENANVRLSIYNVLGQEIQVLVDEFRSAGSYTVEWNAGQMASGMYIYRLQTDAKVLTKKMALLK